MDLEVFVLGTSGMMPLPNRFLTSACVRRNGNLYLFDCGEGVQIALKKLSIHWKKIDSIFISHMHADHVTGLPGILMLSSQVDRTEPLKIYGPSQLEEYVNSNRRILDMYINYDIEFHPVENENTIFENDEMKIVAHQLIHTKPCFGYSLIEKERSGKFFPENAIKLGIPMGPLWGTLQSGKAIKYKGKTIKPSQVLSKTRPGRKFTYITDTLYFPQLAEFAYKSDLLLIEGMFEHSLKEDAILKKHMTALEAGTVAKDALVRQCGLIHYSPRYSDKDIKELEREARGVFANSVACKDRMSFAINYEN